MDGAPQRKPRHYFDVEPGPSHVTFDDGRTQRRNLPWMHYVEAVWDYDEPALIRLEFGEWLVVVRGHNLAPLFQAIEEQVLVRVRARPDLAEDSDHETDSFVESIRFLRPRARKTPRAGGDQFEVPLGK